MALKKVCRCGKIIDYTIKMCDECIKNVKENKPLYASKHRDVYSTVRWSDIRERCISKLNAM